MASIPTAKIAKPDGTDEVEVTSSALHTTPEGRDADGAALTVNPIPIAGVDGSANVQTISTDTAGVVNVNVVSTGSAGTKTIESDTTAALAAAASADLETADIASANLSHLTKVWVGGEQPGSYTISTVQDGTATVVAGPFYFQAGETHVTEIDRDTITLNGGNAGTDAFRVSVTNEDNNKAGDYAATFCFLTD